MALASAPLFANQLLSRTAEVHEPVLGTAAGVVAVVAVGVETQVPRQFMTCVSQFIVQVVNADTDGSNWGGGGTNG
jgi:hypothetical protein